MRAVIRTGGKQVLVADGDTIWIELLANANPGDEVALGEVLMLVDGGASVIGAPAVEGAKVTAKVLSEEKGPKTRAVFFRRRSDSMTVKGHRQRYHKVRITGISR